MDHIEKLFDELQPIAEEVKKKEEKDFVDGHCFNIFSIFSVFGNEWPSLETQHSIFIAELLNPKGTHGAGDKYLRYFLNVAGIKDLDLNPNYSYSNIIERFIGGKTETDGGRIDIILDDGNNALIIENKIDAKDQEHQLIRYNNYAKTRFKKFRLVYLTLDEHKPSEYSTGKNDKVDCVCLSYRDHILTWLKECKETSTPRLAETIDQYIEIIKILTMQTDKKYDEKRTVESAVNHMEATAMLFENWDNIFERAREKFVVEPIERFVKEKGGEIKTNDYLTSGETDTDNEWIVITPTDWKSHKVIIGQTLYPYKDPYEFIGIFGKGGEKLPMFEMKSKVWSMGWMQISPLNCVDALRRMSNGEIATELINLIEKAVEQAEATEKEL